MAVAERDSPMVHIYDMRSGSEEPLESFAPHCSPVAAMRYNAAHDTVISIDQKGALLTPWAILTVVLFSGTLGQLGLLLALSSVRGEVSHALVLRRWSVMHDF